MITIIINQNIKIPTYSFFLLQERPPLQLEKKKEMGVPEKGVSCKLPVKFQDVKFKDPKFKHDILVRIDIKLSYTSQTFS